MRYLLTLGLIAFGCIVVWMLPVWLSVPAKDTGYVAIGALFSALAFAAIFATLIQNQDDLKQQDIRHQKELESLQSQIQVQNDQYNLLVLTSMHTTLTSLVEIVNSEIDRNEDYADVAMQLAHTRFSENMTRLEKIIERYESSEDISLEYIANAVRKSIDAISALSAGSKEQAERMRTVVEFTELRKEFLEPLVASVTFHSRMYNLLLSRIKGETFKYSDQLQKAMEALKQID